MVEYLKTKGHLIADAIAGFFGKDHAGPILVSITTLFTFLGATVGKAFSGIISVIKNNFDKIAILALLFKKQIANIIQGGFTNFAVKKLGKSLGITAEEISKHFKVIAETVKIGIKGIHAEATWDG